MSTCKSEMTSFRANQFRPKSIMDKNIYNCEVCAKYSISCMLKVINKLPPKAIN